MAKIIVCTKKGKEYTGDLKAALKNAPKGTEKAWVGTGKVTFWGKGEYLGKSTVCRAFVPPKE